MIINRVNVSRTEGCDLYLEFEAGEGMPEVLRLCNSIDDGRAFHPAPKFALSLQPAPCRERGEQACDDCPELRCGDQLWEKIREPDYVALATPGASDADRLDAALRLCWTLRCRCAEAETAAAEVRDERDALSKLWGLVRSSIPGAPVLVEGSPESSPEDVVAMVKDFVRQVEAELAAAKAETDRHATMHQNLAAALHHRMAVENTEAVIGRPDLAAINGRLKGEPAITPETPRPSLNTAQRLAQSQAECSRLMVEKSTLIGQVRKLETEAAKLRTRLAVADREPSQGVAEE